MIDLDHLARQTGGDPELQRDLLILFQDQVEQLRADLGREAADPHGSGPADLIASVHRLRGAAAAIGANDLARCLGATEAGAAGPQGLLSGLASLREELDRVALALPGLIAARKGRGLAKASESR